MDFDCIALINSKDCGLCKAGFEKDNNGICQQMDQDNCETLVTPNNETYIATLPRWFQRSCKIIF